MTVDPSEQPEQAPADATETTENTSAETAGEDKPKRGRPKGTARKTRTVELTLTVTGTAEGEWQAELKHGSKWIARGLPVPASAVSRAAKELHDDISTGIDEVITAAREQQRQKLEQLEAEMAKVKQTLADLEA